MAEQVSLIDQYGRPFSRNGKVRNELATLLQPKTRREVSGTYDAAGDSDEYKYYWANSDNYDADSANSREVREKVVPRSRYDVGSNGYADGIAQTYATDVVGTGPKLRMQTSSPKFNQWVEQEFSLWTKVILLRRKLWCMAHAKHVDGEGFGVIRTNPIVNHAVQLDFVIYETEQFQTPDVDMADAGRIDGIQFDKFGNPTFYDLLIAHPGGNTFIGYGGKPEKIPARFVAHWFKLRRPGQHRAMPECASTLNMGASARRYREATIAAAETAADFTLFLKTQVSPDTFDGVSPMSTLDISKRMMTALPDGYDPFQMRAEHPTATYESFHKSLVNEQARPKSMPYNKAACDSSDYNYASGRLDHQTYYSALDVDREDGNDLVLDPLFNSWFDEAIKIFGWLGGMPVKVGPAMRLHGWDWPKHRVADIASEARANNINLRNGTLSLSKRYSEAGEDFEDEILQMSKDYGVTPDEMRKVLLHELFPKGAVAIEPPPEPVVMLPPVGDVKTEDDKKKEENDNAKDRGK